MSPGTFQVYSKIDEESRKDNRLVISFLLTLNDTRGMVTYEFRGICNMTGSASDLESVMETSKNSRVPKILDILYQKLYPATFMLAGLTASVYPQSVALLTDMMSSDPIPVRQEIVAPEAKPEPKIENKPITVQRERASMPTASPKPTALKPMDSIVSKPAAVKSADSIGSKLQKPKTEPSEKPPHQ